MLFGSKSFTFRKDKTIIIAEAGVNHNGDIDIARKMIDMAKKSGADIVKFQLFDSEKEISKYAGKTNYQKQTTSPKFRNQLEVCRALELRQDDIRSLKQYSQSVGVPFLCTAFESDSLDFLVDRLKLKTIKIPSSEVTNIPFLQQTGTKKVSVILSTGASTLKEVAMAVKTLRKYGCPELALLHCVSEYPAPFDQVNLQAMETMRNTFRLPVGFSDHTVGVEVAIAAAALGAQLLEKHFTLDKKMPGPDHQASIEPDELKALVKGVRIANAAKGSGLKRPARCELMNRPLIRKSLMAGRFLKKGTIIAERMIQIKRPESGIKPIDFNKVIGRRLKRNIQNDQPICWKDLI